MFQLDEHWIVLLAIIGIGFIAYIIIAVCGFLLFKGVKKTLSFQDKTLQEMMDYHAEFYDIHERMQADISRIIERQGKIGNILRSMVDENRKHDRKVTHILQMLGETVPNDSPQDPHP